MYTRTRAQVYVAPKSYITQPEDDEEFVVKINVDNISFGLQLNEYEYSVLLKNIEGMYFVLNCTHRQVEGNANAKMYNLLY